MKAFKLDQFNGLTDCMSALD